MSNLFAFNNAEDVEVLDVPAGHYDAEQQTWIAEDASYAEVDPIYDGGGGSSKSVTGTATFGNGRDGDVDGDIDW